MKTGAHSRGVREAGDFSLEPGESMKILQRESGRFGVFWMRRNLRTSHTDENGLPLPDDYRLALRRMWWGWGQCIFRKLDPDPYTHGPACANDPSECECIARPARDQLLRIWRELPSRHELRTGLRRNAGSLGRQRHIALQLAEL